MLYKKYLIDRANFDNNFDKISTYKKQLGEIDSKLVEFDLLELSKVKEAFGAKGIEYQEAQEKVTEILKYLPK
jgi:hypothetical protein